MVALPNAILPVRGTTTPLSDDEDGNEDIELLDRDDIPFNKPSARASRTITTNPFLLARRNMIGANDNGEDAAPQSKVINRLTLSRSNTTSTSTSTGNNNASVRLAFHNPGNSSIEEDTLPPPIMIRQAMAAAKFSSAASRRPAGSVTSINSSSISTRALSTSAAPTSKTISGAKGKTKSVTKKNSSSVTVGLKVKGNKAKMGSVSSFLTR